MNTETEDGFYQSEDDLDEDEATQYIIEQSLIQYRNLKGLNPGLIFNHPVSNVSKIFFLHSESLDHCLNPCSVQSLLIEM